MFCNNCKAPMKPLLTGWYCVHDCDRKPKAPDRERWFIPGATRETVNAFDTKSRWFLSKLAPADNCGTWVYILEGGYPEKINDTEWRAQPGTTYEVIEEAGF